MHTNTYAGFYIRGFLLLFAKAIFKKTIIHIHGAEFKTFFNRAGKLFQSLIRYFININDKVIVLSSERQKYFGSIDIDSGRIIVLHNSVFVPSEIPIRAD